MFIEIVKMGPRKFRWRIKTDNGMVVLNSGTTTEEKFVRKDAADFVRQLKTATRGLDLLPIAYATVDESWLDTSPIQLM